MRKFGKNKNNNCTVINCNLTLNIKLCKRRLSFTFYFAPVGNRRSLETGGASKIVIFRSKSLKLDSIEPKINIKNGLNLKNLQTLIKKLCKRKLSFFLLNYALQLASLGAYKIVKLVLLYRKLYVHFKNGLNLKID